MHFQWTLFKNSSTSQLRQTKIENKTQKGIDLEIIENKQHFLLFEYIKSF